MISTIKELKDIIKDLPDDMEVTGYNGGNGDLVQLSSWFTSDEDLNEEELKDSHPNGFKATLVISTD